MTERERLIELIKQMPKEMWAEELADYLLANGVIVPPCKVGDLLYMPWEYGGISGVAMLGVTYMVIDKDELRIMTDFSSDDEEYFDLYCGGKFVPSDFGETVFLTREEAEAALKERTADDEEADE